MFRRILAAILTAPDANSANTSIFLGYDVESDVEIVERRKKRDVRNEPPDLSDGLPCPLPSPSVVE